ncbi:HNH endonuclease signature motif containing protein [Leptolyngbya ohadii]|uniref:HNH endonuclease signature motif containing protein n=1 Tax=Leptolyngbya ohadii TaxID=1962290 RepID=UPI00117B2753|nr:HNH endonuclease signature motif containing protein [Leptolyngbya ohadii]
MSRKDPTIQQRERLLQKNAGVCCVCKKRGLGINLHHIDGDNSNTIDENLAVLCVKDHDLHHRPHAYSSSSHLELGASEIRELKESWEGFVAEAQKPNSMACAVLTMYGTHSEIHSIQAVFQWANGKIEFERTYHQLDRTAEDCINNLFSQFEWLGTDIKLIIIDEPLPVEYCPCCSSPLKRFLAENQYKRIFHNSWEAESLCAIYINPHQPSLALSLFLEGEVIYQGALHLCGNFLHYTCSNFEERFPITKRASVRTQVTGIIQEILDIWNPGHIFIGTGDHEDPCLIGNFDLPKFWEKLKGKKVTWECSWDESNCTHF